MSLDSGERSNHNTHLDIIRASAKKRAKYTRSFFDREQISMDEFVERLKNSPFKIKISPSDDKSLACGISKLQKILEFPEDDSGHGCDGRFGPYTFRAFIKFILGRNTKNQIRENTATTEKALESHKNKSENVRETNIKVPKIGMGQFGIHGDSLAVGFSREMDTAKKICKGGKQTSWMKKELSSNIDTLKEQGLERIFCMGGFNDITSLKSVSTVIKNLRQDYDNIKSRGMTVVAGTIPTFNVERFLKHVKVVFKKRGWGRPKGVYPLSAEQLVERIEKVNDWIRSQHDIVVVDIYKETLDWKKYPRVDSVHFTSKSNKLLAQFIREKSNVANDNIYRRMA